MFYLIHNCFNKAVLNIIYVIVFNQVFNENLVILMLKSVAGGVRACGRQLLVSAQ